MQHEALRSPDEWLRFWVPEGLAVACTSCTVWQGRWCRATLNYKQDRQGGSPNGTITDALIELLHEALVHSFYRHTVSLPTPIQVWRQPVALVDRGQAAMREESRASG
jgi:hypothetical protein